MNNPLHITRLFRADRLRREYREPRRVVVRPSDYGRAANDSRRLDRDTAVFVVCAVLAVLVFWLSVLGVL